MVEFCLDGEGNVRVFRHPALLRLDTQAYSNLISALEGEIHKIEKEWREARKNELRARHGKQ